MVCMTKNSAIKRRDGIKRGEKAVKPCENALVNENVFKNTGRNDIGWGVTVVR